MTSLNMPGFSVSLVLLPQKKSNVTIDLLSEGTFTITSDLILDMLDAPTDCLGWANCYKGEPNIEILRETPTRPSKDSSTESGPEDGKEEPNATS